MQKGGKYIYTALYFHKKTAVIKIKNVSTETRISTTRCLFLQLLR